ncbi:hypothetical protein SeMB42_g07230 [Synchytrium endobioticum]|uniref:RPA43 OB domain-containing protein n=1 Tax=Synchytrium endobioticum TaxID=286115 RepID=A0A507C0U1_9FUNG|nr:hypothetical protein SeMB42_g07230 [Synchytrium endobioticum]TPX50182.1 hypothetical protein SeLEV6574_g01022 [Synchytrium endobioticum]
MSKGKKRALSPIRPLGDTPGSPVGGRPHKKQALDITPLPQQAPPQTNLHAPFRKCQVIWQMTIPPVFAGNIMDGIHSIINAYLIKYMPELDGVLLSYTAPLLLVSSSARIINDSPYLHFPIKTTLTIFAPPLRSNIVGIVNKVSPDHIGCLVCGIFNASIPSDAMRRDEMSWSDEQCCWIVNGEAMNVGSAVRFSVADLIKRNSMLSISGSLRLDPQNTGLIPSSLLENHAPPPLQHEEFDMDVDTLQTSNPTPNKRATHVRFDESDDDDDETSIKMESQHEHSKPSIMPSADPAYQSDGDVDITKVKKEKKEKASEVKRFIEPEDPIGGISTEPQQQGNEQPELMALIKVKKEKKKKSKVKQEPVS